MERVEVDHLVLYQAYVHISMYKNMYLSAKNEKNNDIGRDEIVIVSN